MFTTETTESCTLATVSETSVVTSSEVDWTEEAVLSACALETASSTIDCTSSVEI